MRLTEEWRSRPLGSNTQPLLRYWIRYYRTGQRIQALNPLLKAERIGAGRMSRTWILRGCRGLTLWGESEDGVRWELNCGQILTGKSCPTW
jgi:hypothetical protein